ncbi:TRAP transporter permease [Halomarina pelagica]|uniref:TRAP transporter permease n=1 Tax=Halomarina pelagica TaxID=2961599 RepID=UPI0020C518A7|nr:TRAP transporter fused permease subunit [Halomarina sp. BND7]
MTDDTHSRTNRPLADADESNHPPRRPDGGTVDSPADDDVLSEEEREELRQEIERKRDLRGATAVLVSVIGILFSAFQMWLAARGQDFELTLPFGVTVDLGQLQALQVNAIHVTFALVLAFLLFPTTTGDGFLSRRLARVVPAVRTRFGASSPATRAAEGVRRGVRWFMVDDDFERVTPLDALFVLFSIMAGGYIVTDFEEILNLRLFGIDQGAPIQEVFTFLAVPVQAISALGIPLDTLSYAYLVGIVGVLMVLEATRRTLGLPLTIIVASFIVYAHYGHLISVDTPVVGVLAIDQFSWAEIVQNLWYNVNNGVFGIPVSVSVQFIYIFILFGAFLETSGAGQWFIDLAYAATGTRKGGPAKASVLASGFMGTISGSSIANTVTTGAFTIPLMKRSGYSPEFSGAVESSASSGGQILPPVMGAAAFLMIQYTGTPFSDIITAAAVPAVVFFFGVWVMVHLEASRVGIGGLSKDEVIDTRTHVRRGWFYLVPVVLLLYYLLIARLSVARSAWFTLVAIMALIAFVAAYNERTRLPLIGVVAMLTLGSFAAYLVTGTGLVGLVTGAGDGGVGLRTAAYGALGDLGTIVIVVSLATLLLRPHLDSPLLDYDAQVDEAVEETADLLNRPRLTDNAPFTYGGFVLQSMNAGARTAVEVVIAVAAAGIIPGVVASTGLGPNLVQLIANLAGGSIVLLLVVTAISAIILGMGMPTTVTYIILSALLVPAITELSAIPVLAAHLFVLYFGVIADITPPVAVAAYAASGIAKSDPFKTGVEAFSLSLNKAIVPFAFVLTPGILLIRGTGENATVVGLGAVADPAFFLLEVLVPIAGVFLGVVALGATVIGFLYAGLGRGQRALFALSAFLLMAPKLLLNAVFDLLAALGVAVGIGDPLLLDLVLRGLGGALFGVLAVVNRRGAAGESTTTEEVAPTTD